jgi:hypothetical protein
MMIPILLCLLALQADDPTSGLIQKLGDDDAAVREKATADLIKLGEGRRPDLEKALKEATAPEIAARLRSVLARFDVDRRRREFKGGFIVDDLGATLTCDYDPKARQLAVSVEVTNLGTTDRTIVPINSWNLSLPGMTSSSSNSEGQIQVRQLVREPLRGGRFSSRISCGPSPVRTPLILRPGERKVFKHTVDTTGLAAGEHEVQAKFFGKRLSGMSDDLESNAQKFQVEP